MCVCMSRKSEKCLRKKKNEIVNQFHGILVNPYLIGILSFTLPLLLVVLKVSCSTTISFSFKFSDSTS